MTTTRKVQPRKRVNQHFVVVASGGCRDRISFFSFSWLQFLVHIPKNPSDEARKNAKGALLKTLAPNPQIYPKSFPKPSQNHPKPSQNPPKIAPKPYQTEGNWKCSHENKKSWKKIVSGQCPPPFWTPFWTPKASQERPKSLPKAAKMEPKTRKKRCLKTSCFQTRFFHGLEVVFNGFLNDFW